MQCSAIFNHTGECVCVCIFIESFNRCVYGMWKLVLTTCVHCVHITYSDDDEHFQRFELNLSDVSMCGCGLSDGMILFFQRRIYEWSLRVFRSNVCILLRINSRVVSMECKYSHSAFVSNHFRWLDLAFITETYEFPSKWLSLFRIFESAKENIAKACYQSLWAWHKCTANECIYLYQSQNKPVSMIVHSTHFHCELKKIFFQFFLPRRIIVNFESKDEAINGLHDLNTFKLRYLFLYYDTSTCGKSTHVVSITTKNRQNVTVELTFDVIVHRYVVTVNRF